MSLFETLGGSGGVASSGGLMSCLSGLQAGIERVDTLGSQFGCLSFVGLVGLSLMRCRCRPRHAQAGALGYCWLAA